MRIDTAHQEPRFTAPETRTTFDWNSASTAARFLAENAKRRALESKGSEQKSLLANSETFSGVQNMIDALAGNQVNDTNEAIELLEISLESIQKTLRLSKDSRQQDRLMIQHQATEATIDFLRRGFQDFASRADFKEWKRDQNQQQTRREQQQQRQRSQEVREGVAEANKELERLLVEQVIKEGGITVYTSVPKEYSQDKRLNGFVDFIDPKRLDAGAATRADSVSSMQTREELESQGIHEAVALKPLTMTERVQKPVEKRGWLGKKTVMEPVWETRQPLTNELVAQGKPEPAFVLSYRTVDGIKEAHYQDYSGRYGQVLSLRIVLPESLAKTIRLEIAKNPAIMRTIAEKVMRDTFHVPKQAWEHGDEATHRVPLKPPYEAWKKQSRGKALIHFETSSQQVVLEIKS